MKRKILLVISKFPPEYSGPGVRLPRLYKWLLKHRENYTFSVICNGKEQTKSKSYEHDGMHVDRVVPGIFHIIFRNISFLPDRFKNSLLYQIEFLQTLVFLFLHEGKSNTNLVHIVGHSGGTAAALVWAKIKCIPVILELVTANAPYRQKYLYLFKTPVSKQFKVVALTRDMRDKCLAKGLPNSQLWCRPNPIDEKKFLIPSVEEKVRLRTKLTKFTADQTIMTSVAKIMPQKNQLLIIQILKHLPNNFVALIGGPIIGNGPLHQRDLAYFDEIKELVSRHKLEDRVQLTADFVTADEYMKLADIYLMPAWNEGLGTPMLEAMGCGLPVIGNSKEPAFQEWIEDGRSGFLCDITKPQEWAAAANNLSNYDDTQRLAISKNAHISAGQVAIYSRYENIIEQFIQENDMI